MRQDSRDRGHSRPESHVHPGRGCEQGVQDLYLASHSPAGVRRNRKTSLEVILQLSWTTTTAPGAHFISFLFISQLPSIYIHFDEFCKVKTTDHRLLRRMSRDYLFRGNSAVRALMNQSRVELIHSRRSQGEDLGHVGQRAEGRGRVDLSPSEQRRLRDELRGGV